MHCWYGGFSYVDLLIVDVDLVNRWQILESLIIT